MAASPNIVLVHGAWADGSCWSDVIQRLQADGYNVTAPQLPESSLADDVARVRHVLSRQRSPTILAGHSYGGQVITSLGTDAPNVELLLFLFATLNITLAVINLIPLLPFDGGHIAVAVYERIQERRKRMQGRYFADVAKLLPLTYAVVLILFLLMISSIYLGIASPITE